MRPQDEEPQGPVIRDRRRIDPVTGQVRDSGQAGQAGQAQRGPGQPHPGKHSVSKPGGGSGASQAGSSPAAAVGDGPGPDAGQRDGEVEKLTVQLTERTADLQRLQAEYANYRKRVDRDRIAVREQALANVLTELLPVIDDIGRAREHGELTGGFKSVAESLESVATKLGLTSYGENGDPFDPNLHEALMHSYSADVTEPTCVRILQPGYKVADRILRPARVAVAEPGDDSPADQADDGEPAATPGDAPKADDAGETAAGDASGKDTGDAPDTAGTN
jgi:molecular chaperone GrpE